jgi:Regulator of chromosome condensation (RCC1) repeat
VTGGLACTACAAVISLDDLHYTQVDVAPEVGPTDGTVFDADSGSDATRPLLLTANGNQACALLPDAAVYCWGGYIPGLLSPNAACGPCLEPVPVDFGDAARPVRIASGYDHVCVVLADGNARCWGDNTAGELGVGPVPFVTGSLGVVDGTGFSQIVAGFGVTCGLLTDGGVVCWGSNASGLLGADVDGSMDMPPAVPGLSGVAEVELASELACARLVNGGVVCWGDGTADGFDCDAGAICSPSPVPISLGDAGDATVARLSVGAAHACALMTDTTVRCWGFNDEGQLGDGTDTNRVTAVLFGFKGTSSPLAGVVNLGCGSNTTCVVFEDGGLACAGNLSAFGLPTSEGAELIPQVPGTDGSVAMPPVQSVALNATNSGTMCFALTAGGADCIGDTIHGELGRGVCWPDGGEPYCGLGPVNLPP